LTSGFKKIYKVKGLYLIMKKRKEKRDFLWWGLRIGFCVTICFVALSTLLIPSLLLEIYDRYNLQTFMSIFFVSATISLIFIAFTVTISILSLIKGRKRILPIIALIISGFLTWEVIFTIIDFTRPPMPF